MFVVVGCSFTAKQHHISNWSEKEKIFNPESIYYDQNSELIFVASIDGDGKEKDGKGHISLFSKDGNAIEREWISNINAPKGMRAFGGTLWVSNIDEVLKIDIAGGKIINRFPIKDALFLNDIAISKEGDVFVSDTLRSTIHIIKNNKVSVFVEGDEWESPNGLLVVGDQLIVAAWGLTKDFSTKVVGRLYSINIKNKKKTLITKKPLGHLDGIERLSDGNYLVSDWRKGLIYRVDKNGEAKVVFKGKRGLADIGYIPESKTILIPYMKDNKVFSIILP